MSEAWIVEAVVCYDFLHNELTKPVQAMGLSGNDVDPSFRGKKFNNSTPDNFQITLLI